MVIIWLGLFHNESSPWANYCNKLVVPPSKTHQRCCLQNPAISTPPEWIVSDRKNDQPFVDWLVPHTQMTPPHCGQTHIPYHIGEIHTLVGFIPSFCLGISKKNISPLSNWLIPTWKHLKWAPPINPARWGFNHVQLISTINHRMPQSYVHQRYC